MMRKLRIRIADYRRVLFSLVVIGGLLTILTTVASAQPWTTIGSAGTVDDADRNEVVFSNPYASVSGVGIAPFPRTVVLRYNVVAEPGLAGGNGVQLTARFLDNGGAGTRVRLRLFESRITAGAGLTNKLTLTSNAVAPSPNIRTLSVNNCRTGGGNFFDFGSKAYFVEATLDKSAAAAAISNPRLYGIRIRSINCPS